MKTTVMRPVEVEIVAVKIHVAVRYGTDDMPMDFPGREGDMWRITVDIDTGKIDGWPKGVERDLYMKVCDDGSYYLLDGENRCVAGLENEYVPHGVVPGEFGDYIDLHIQPDGVIENWPTYPNVDEFFGGNNDGND